MAIRRFQYAYVHSEFVLLALTSVYFYRDILPLTTFTQQPKDASIGWRLWAKILSLIVGGIVIPLLAPSEYTPIDAEDPTENLNAEQMAPLLSRIVYSFLDSFTFSSFRNPDSIQDRIPSVAYRYQAKYLKKSAFPIVDPFLSKNKEKYIFWTMFEFYSELLLLISFFSYPIIRTGPSNTHCSRSTQGEYRPFATDLGKLMIRVSLFSLALLV